MLEIPRCTCGVPMVEGNNSGVFVCMNCDGVQKSEMTEIRPGVFGERRKTPQDIAYEVAWRNRIKEQCPG